MVLHALSRPYLALAPISPLSRPYLTLAPISPLSRPRPYLAPISPSPLSRPHHDIAPISPSPLSRPCPDLTLAPVYVTCVYVLHVYECPHPRSRHHALLPHPRARPLHRMSSLCGCVCGCTCAHTSVRIKWYIILTLNQGTYWISNILIIKELKFIN